VKIVSEYDFLHMYSRWSRKLGMFERW